MAEHTLLWRIEETMALLDDLGFEGSGNEAQAALIAAGKGRERAIVLWAQKYRRTGVPAWAREAEADEIDRRLQHRVESLEAKLADARRGLAEAERRLAEQS
jgi:uncharacterized protein YceH (UPF0502 family)